MREKDFKKKSGKLLVSIAAVFCLLALICPSAPVYAQYMEDDYIDDGSSGDTPLTPPENAVTSAAIPASGTPGPVGTAAKVLVIQVAHVHKNLIGPTINAIIATLGYDAISFVLDTLAYKTAVWLASGGQGQEPLFEARSAVEAWENFGLDVAGNAVNGLTVNISEYFDVQFNLCAPPDPLLRLGLQLGLVGMYQPPKPKCDWQSIMGNWEGFVQGAMESAEDPSKYMLEQFAKSLEPGQNTLSYVIGVNMTVQGKVAEKKGVLFQEFLAKEGVKDVVDAITGRVRTPAALVKKTVEDRILSVDNAKLSTLGKIMTDKAIWAQIGMRTLSVFTNTLLSTWFNKIRLGLLPDIVYPEIDLASGIGGTATWDRSAAEEFYSDLVSTTKLSLDSYTVLTEFVTCPASSTTTRQSNNCVMDANFIQAVAKTTTTESMTVAQAIEDGFLHGDWPLYRPDDLKHNQDPLCYTYGYCYGNLVKLRKARIISIGWELAATSEQNSSSSPITLQEVVDGFNYCNSDGKADSEHSWCHLIDPNWVLKYPSQQCLASMIGEQTLGTMISGRSGTCVDSPSCISDNIDGSCNGYGYCVREMNTWNFNGDSCPEEYAGCLSFTNTDTSTSGSWLFNTLDQGLCSSDSAGCMWYRANKYFDNAGTTDTGDDAYEWLPGDEVYLTTDATDPASRDNDILSFTAGGVQSPRVEYGYYDADEDGKNDYTYDIYSYEDRIYFNSEIQACTEASVGCSEIYPVNDDLSLNILRNASFEDDTDNNDIADYWEPTLSISSDYDEEGANSFSGTDAYHLLASSDKLIKNSIPLQQGNFYTISLYAKGDATTTNVGTVTLDLTASDNKTDVDLAGYSMDCLLDAAGDSVTLNIATTSTTDFQSFDCSFTTPFFDDERLFLVANLTVAPTTGGLYVDAIQLEAQATASSFHDGYNSSAVSAEYLQLPPDWLGCSGSVNDPAECASYAAVCSATEAGCSLYTPVDGDPAVPAVLADGDECPEECVGYAAYRQEDTDYDTGEFPLYFIAETAQGCTSADVGCDEYTNLETEGTEAFSYLRACVTPEMNAGEVYFTWEGSDQTGYQLISYQLLKSNLTDIDGEDATSLDYTQDEDGDLDFDDDNAVNDEAAGLAPCTTWDVTSEAVLGCVDNAVILAALDDCNEHADILTNPDCREFYDEQGKIHYRLYSDTVSVSDACTAYRKTEPDKTDCDNSGGFFTAAGECRYFVEPSGSTACADSAAGCREYTGGSSRNSSVIFSDYFEEGSYDNWQSNDTSLTLSVSNESVAVDGHSLRVAAGVGDSFKVLKTVTTDQIVAGKTFVVSFWAKGTGSLTVGMMDSDGTGATHNFGSSVALTGSWQLFELGPIDTSASGFESFDENAVLTFFASATSSQTFYLDNIQLKQTEEDLTLIKDSWITPSTCDQTPAGAPALQYYLGCEEYTDQNEETFYLYQFSNLCSEDVVGCEAVYDTQNSESPYTEYYNLTCKNSDGTDADLLPDIATSPIACSFGSEEVCTILAGYDNCQFNYDGNLPVPLPDNIQLGPEAVYVPADQIKYMVVDDNFTCEADNMGCIEVGTPKFSQDRTVVESFESAYLLNQPDTYDTTLCSNGELFCGEWASTQDGNYYFKDPGDKNCEYKTGVTVNNATYDGWFRTGTNEFCYGSGWCSGADLAGDSVVCNEDQNCATKGAGTCVITDGSYLINGDYSGIWRNGDTLYDSWVGSCNSQYNLCTEFVDPLATQEGESSEGTSFFYLDNQSLDESTLSASDRCDGQVGLLSGCVLFADQLSQELSYTTSPSYLVSEHADVFFGDSPRSLQDPVSCDDPETNGAFTLTTGDEVNVCEQRCSYEVSYGHGVNGLTVVEGPENETADISIFFGAACIYDTDCQPGKDSITNADIEGSCFNLDLDTNGNGAVAADEAIFGTVTDLSSYITANDANRILKVYRSRECAEWLACSNSYAAWDERVSQWTNVCEEVNLCDQYDASSVEGSTCTSWTAGEAVVLDLDQYTSRDTSWYGLDYSGYAIPNQLPVEFYEQIDTYPEKACQTMLYGIGTISDPPLACEDDDDCADIGSTCVEMTENNYSLAYIASSCEKENGETCTAGYCTDTGKSCSEDVQCPNGDCIVGNCEMASSTNCTDDIDCEGIYVAPYSYNKCRNGICTDITTGSDGGLANVVETCGVGQVCSGYSSGVDCVPGALAKTGSCYNGACLVGLDGYAFESDGSSEKICRGYPEVSSPFPGMVVNSWIEPGAENALDTGVSYTMSVKPYDFVYGFNNANVCSPTSGGDPVSELTEANECSCSYEKATYGESAAFKYYPLDTQKDRMLPGVCVGGEKPGLECSQDSFCNPSCDSADPITGGTSCSGTCQKIAKSEHMFGWDGYCLEHDSSVQLYGSPDDKDRACLSWLPVDQLAGSRDMYANDTEAGYGIGEDIYYCSEVGMYADLYPLGAKIDSTSGEVTEMDYACASSEILVATGVERHNNCPYNSYGSADLDYPTCNQNVVCPPNYIGIVGVCDQDKDPSTVDQNGNGHFEYDSTGEVVDCGDSCDDVKDEEGVGDVLCYDSEDSIDKDKRAVDAISDDMEDCPYFCIPANSYHLESGTPCQDDLEVLVSNGYGEPYTAFSRTVYYGRDLFNPKGATMFGGKSIHDNFKDCVYRGVPFGSETAGTAGNVNFNGQNSNGYFYYDPGSIYGAYGIAAWPIGNVSGSGYCSESGAECFSSADCPDTPDTCYSGFCLVSGGACDFVSPCPGVVQTCGNGPYDTGTIMPYLGCYELIQVSNATDGNKAWTNRMYSLSDYTTSTSMSTGLGSWFVKHEFIYSTLPTPFGEAQFGKYYTDGYLNEFESDSWPLPVASCESSNALITRSDCSVSDYAYPGEAQYAIDADNNLLADGDSPNNLAVSFEEINSLDWDELISLDDADRFDELGNSQNSTGYSITDLLQQIFAQVFVDSVWRYDWDGGDNNSGFYDEISTSYSTIEDDISNQGDVNGGYGANNGEPTAPTILSVGLCYGTECREGTEGAFSVNDVEDENLEGNGGTMHAGVQFYAYADNNQMPIRNVIVDWGDGEREGSYATYNWPLDSQTGSDGDTSYFKNRRGFDSDGKEICNSEDEWGLTSNACQTAYFSFEKDYYCSEDIVNALADYQCDFVNDGTGRLLYSPCTGGTFDGISADGKCVFQPRVFVKDNWGWCTGYCNYSSAGDGTDGCYGGDECDPNYCPDDGSGSLCRDDGVDVIINPWINYDGVIVLDWQNLSP